MKTQVTLEFRAAEDGTTLVSVEAQLRSTKAVRFNGVWYQPVDAQKVVELDREWDEA